MKHDNFKTMRRNHETAEFFMKNEENTKINENIENQHIEELFDYIPI